MVTLLNLLFTQLFPTLFTQDRNFILRSLFNFDLVRGEKKACLTEGSMEKVILMKFTDDTQNVLFARDIRYPADLAYLKVLTL